MFHQFEELILSWAEVLPLEVFAFVASFIEEVFAPIPSMAVLLITGSIASLQDRTLLDLIPLVMLAAAGKTIGATIVYFFADRIGSVVVDKYGKFFGVSNEAIASFGSKITGTPKDYLLLTVFRALPIVPSAVVSVGCGILKIKHKLYIISTLLGTIVRDSIFIYAGYTGVELLYNIINQSTTLEDLVQTIFLVFVGILLGYLYWKRNQS